MYIFPSLCVNEILYERKHLWWQAIYVVLIAFCVRKDKIHTTELTELVTLLSHNITISQYYYLTILLSHSITISQYYYLTILLSHNITISQYYYLTILLSHNITISQYYYLTILLSHNITISQYYYLTLLLSYNILVMRVDFSQSASRTTKLYLQLHTVFCNSTLILHQHWCNGHCSFH